MNVTQQGIPYFMTGDKVIQIFKGADLNRKNPQIFDLPTTAAYFDNENDVTKHLGEFTYFGQRQPQLKGMAIDILKNRQVIETGQNGRFTYDAPIFENDQCITKQDTSKLQDFPGIDGGTFKLILSEEFKPGDILGTDYYSGQQVVVTDEVVLQKGDAFEHIVSLLSDDKEEWYSPSNLMEGITYFKLTSVIGGERDDWYSGVGAPQRASKMRMEFQLGSGSGVEMGVTALADIKSDDYKMNLPQGFISDLGSTYEQFSEKFGDITVTMDRDPMTGDFMPSTMRVSTVAQTLVKRELMRQIDNRAMFVRSGTIQTANGKTKVSEGLWWQLKRGKNIKYARPGGITRQHISEMVEYLFQARPDIDTHERHVKIKAGKFAEQNIIDIFHEEFYAQMDRLSAVTSLLGNDGQIPNSPITGTLDALKLAVVRVGGVFIPGIGNVEVEHDRTLDYLGSGGDRLLGGGMHPNGLTHGTHCAVVWDAKSQEYSNNEMITPSTGATKLEGAPENASVYMVKRPGELIYEGFSQGRYSHLSTREIISNGSRKRASDFWAWDTGCAYFLADPTAFCMIELSEGARRGFN